MNSTVKLTREDSLAWLTIERTEALNALNEEVLSDLLSHLNAIKEDPEIRVVLVTGSGEKAFVAGADIQLMSGYKDRQIADYLELGGRVMRAIELCPKPVIAVVNGFALGGGLELALACDLIYAAESAKLGQPEVNLGIIPGFGATQRLVQRCGVGTAKRLIFTAEIIKAEEAKALHLVDGVFPAQDLRAEVISIAQQIASKGPLAVQKSKRAVQAAGQETLLAGLQNEVELFLEVFSTEDREEGMRAFLEKRSPQFTGK